MFNSNIGSNINNVMNLYKFSESVGNYTYYKLNLSSIDNYIDIDLLKWMIWLFTPVVVSNQYLFITNWI